MLHKRPKRVALATAITGLALTTVTPAMAFAATLANWHLGETSGSTMVDASGNGHNGSISSGVTLGKTGYNGGKAYGFNGNGGRVTVPSTSSLSTGSGSFSVSLYFKSSTLPSSSVADYDLIRKGLSTTTGGDWKLEVLRSGVAFCHFRGASGTVDLTGTTNVVTGSYHKLGCKYSSSGTQLLVDSTVQASSSKVPGSVNNTALLMVGAKSSTEDMTTGDVDEILLTKS